MIARGIILFLVFLWPLTLFSQEPQDIQVTVTDEVLTPLDSIQVALISRISGDTLEIQLTDENGMAEFLEVVITSEEIEPSIPNTLQLSPGYPNPFQEGVSVSAQFTEDSRVVAEVYNTLGQRVLSIPEQRVTAGVHTLNLHMGGLVDGVYFLRLFQNGRVVSRQLTKVGGTSGRLLNGSWSQGGVSSKSHLKVTVISEETDLEIHIYDELGEFESDTIAVLPNKFTYSAELSQKTPTETRETTITLHNSSLGVDANGVDIIIKNEQGETLEQGEFVDGQYVYNRLVEQGSTENLQITFAEHGYIDKTIQYQTSGNATLEETIQAVPITVRTQALEIEPNSSQSINVQTQYVQSVMDPDGTGEVALEAIVVSEPSANITATQEDGYVYIINALNDAQNSNESVQLEVRTATNTVSGTGAIYITSAASITVQGPFAVSEDDTLRLLNFAANYLQSEADITSWDVAETDMNVEVHKDGEDVLLIPAKDYFGSANFSVQASNEHGTSIDETAFVDVDRLPRAYLTYEVNANNSAPNVLGLESHLFVTQDGVENEYRSLNGEFEIKLRSDEIALNMHFDRNDEVFGYKTLDTLYNTGQDMNVLIRGESAYLLDEDKNIAGELKLPGDPTAVGVDNMPRFAEWTIAEHAGGLSPWNLDFLAHPGIPNRFKSWDCIPGQEGPDRVLLADSTYDVGGEIGGAEHSMSDLTRGVIYKHHATLQKLTDGQLVDITEVPYVVMDNRNNNYKCASIYSGFASGGGKNRAFIYETNVGNSISFTTTTRAEDDLDAINETHLNEIFGTLGNFSVGTSDEYTTGDQAVGDSRSNLQNFTLYDMKAIRADWEVTYSGTVRVTDRFGIPNLTTHK